MPLRQVYSRYHLPITQNQLTGCDQETDRYHRQNSMDHESIVVMAKAFTMAIGGVFPALAIGKIVTKAMESIGRNPESSDRLFTPMLLGAAFAEAIAIYSFVVVLILK